MLIGLLHHGVLAGRRPRNWCMLRAGVQHLLSCVGAAAYSCCMCPTKLRESRRKIHNCMHSVSFGSGKMDCAGMRCSIEEVQAVNAPTSHVPYLWPCWQTNTLINLLLKTHACRQSLCTGQATCPRRQTLHLELSCCTVLGTLLTPATAQQRIPARKR